MAKEFKTYDELVSLLQSRNVETDELTKTQIMRESYYAIVNGYKDPFLDKDAMQKSSDDIYLKGTKFEWLYSLFSFDRDLRSLTFKYLTQAESIMKNAIVYAFCEKHNNPYDYLERSNYTDAKNILVPQGYSGNKFKLFQDNLATLMRILNSKISGRSSKSFIQHYLDTYGFVPLWVLQNDLTFGHIAHFYQLQTRSIQNRACKIIAEAIGRPGTKNLTPMKLLHAFSVLVEYRNICAHDERLYCARVGKSHDIDFYQMALSLILVLPTEEFNNFLDGIFDLFAKYDGTLHVVTSTSLLKNMGFKVEEN